MTPFERLRRRLEYSNIPGLDGLRAISVGLVILYHAELPISGPLGVLIFFVLSGFLITWLLLKEDERTGTISLRGFYRRRTLRIFPAFYCFWFIAVGLRLLARGSVPWATAWSSFFYYANYYHGIVRPADQFLIHTWSLAVEEQFYMCWPLIFLLFRKDRARLAWVTAGIIGIVWAHRTALCLSGTPYQYTRYTFDCRADSILWGCLLAILVRSGILAGFWNVVCGRAWLALIPAAAIGVIAHAGVPDVIGLAVLPPLVAVLMAQLVLQSETKLWGWLNAPAARYLGRISYPLYLYHGIGLGIASRLPGGLVVELVLTVAISVGLASLSYFVVEKPLLKYKAPARPVLAGAIS